MCDSYPISDIVIASTTQTVTEADRREESHNRSSLLKKEVKARQIVSAHKNLNVSEAFTKEQAHPLRSFSTGWFVCCDRNKEISQK
jgi:hypothetical protein